MSEDLSSGADERFVAHFDILGMTELTRRDPALAWELLSKLAISRNRILNMGIAEVATGKLIQNELAWLTFSDTILVFSEGDERKDAIAMGLLCRELFSSALAGSVPLRGAIAHGKFLFNPDESLYLGPALVEAYTLSEGSQWLGICLDERTASLFAEYLPRAGDGCPAVVDWDLPMRAGSVRRGAVLNWVCAHKSNFKVAPPFSVPTFYTAFHQLFGPFEDLDRGVQRKYEEATRFLNEMFAR